ncbi:gibberellin 2-beta-dioxygenase-like [Cornus florida]|uniref:gibberellin 2-beta-dioxygenase-like n=1 Tax=Cornus florida TaxID=4283 RepID=UPI00289E1D65|nr:gibberellin 2-beta-dioxygenase-like [Cornus florida]
MLALPQTAGLEKLALIKPYNPSINHFTGIPVINLSSPDAKNHIVDACQQFGFFKLINHGVSIDITSRLEVEAIKFFDLEQPDKDKAGPLNPFGYANKTIGQNGDMGWLEYLLFSTNPELLCQTSLSISTQNPAIFWSALNDYVSAVKNMCFEVLELIVDALKIGPRNALSKLLRDYNSDSILRINHYPPCPELQAFGNQNFIGFGEHTDPQIISVLRSNNTCGLQIALCDGTWVSVPPDPFSFFINIGDVLQVLTNGRFRSVKHRVLSHNSKSRVSMIFFGAPPLTQKITPISSLMEEGEEYLYTDFSWAEYKNSALKTRLNDHRLRAFERTFN